MIVIKFNVLIVYVALEFAVYASPLSVIADTRLF